MSHPHLRRWRVFASALLLAACGPPGPGDVARDGVESREEPFPSQVSAVLTAARAAMGLDQTIPGVVADAAVESPGRAFRTLIYSTAGGAVRMEQTTPFLAVVDANDSWTLQGDSVVSPLDDATRAYVRGHELHALALMPETRLSEPAYLGAVQFEGADALAIRWTVPGAGPPGGRTPEAQMPDVGSPERHTLVTFYAASDTLPLGIRAEWVEPHVDAHFVDWSPLVTGPQPEVRLFRRARFRQADEVFVYTFERVELVEVSDSLLRPPR